MELTQSEADFLLAMTKNPTVINLPFDYTKRAIELLSPDGREAFTLDITPNRVKLHKVTYQNRAKKSVILVRLDIGGPPHRNPDDEEVPCPHIHLYREGYGDKWAYPLPEQFNHCVNIFEYLEEFCKMCNISENPYKQMPLI
jgi:hypothetical protein